jgi:CheY-like chemotaxis protein
MGNNILLIENDASFAREVTGALEANGFGVRTTGDGKEGLELAFDLSPDLIVLCVELPRMSGYSVCNKLKKDDALRGIPLVIISAEATPETFEQHRKLKTRAEDYLIKPFPPQTLVEHVASLLGVPLQADPEAEVVTLDDVELEATPLEVEGEAAVGAAVPDEDEDLRMLDDAFDSISRGDAGVDEPPAKAPPAPRGAPVAAPPAMAAQAAAPPPAAVAELEMEMAAALEALDEPLAPTAAATAPPSAAASAVIPPPPLRPRPPRADGPRPVVRLVEPEPEPLMAEHRHPVGGEDPVVLRAELDEVRQALEERSTEAASLRGELARFRDTAAGVERETGSRDSELKSARARLEAAQGSIRRLEADLRASREEGHRAHDRVAALENDLAGLRGRLENEVATARARLEAAEQLASARGSEVAAAMTKAESLERSLEEARTEITVTQNEAEELRGEVDRRSAELRRRVQELEAAATRNEERVAKALQRIKADEKLRERLRAALDGVAEMLDDRPSPDVAAAGGPERPAG